MKFYVWWLCCAVFLFWMYGPSLPQPEQKFILIEYNGDTETYRTMKNRVACQNAAHMSGAEAAQCIGSVGE